MMEKIERYAVTAIKASAFTGNRIITGLVLTNTIRTIGSCAFKGRNSLEKIHFENTELLTVEQLNYTSATIGDKVFENCSALKEANLSEKLVMIGSAVLSGTGITSMVILRNLKQVTGPYKYND